MFNFSFIETFLIQTWIIFVNADKRGLFRVSLNKYQNFEFNPFNISQTGACRILWTNDTDIAVLTYTWYEHDGIFKYWRILTAEDSLEQYRLAWVYLFWSDMGLFGGDWDTSNDVLSQIKHRGHIPSANYLFSLCQTIIPAKASSFVTFFVCLCDLLEKTPCTHILKKDKTKFLKIEKWQHPLRKKVYSEKLFKKRNIYIIYLRL